VPVYVWVALGIFVALVVPTSLLALVRTIGVFRRLGRASEAAMPAVDALALKTERVAEGAERAARGAARVEEAVRRLAVSRSRLATLLWALEDVRRLLALRRVVIPRK
jgi:hypothetical protein